jgi:hypothetical protein
MNHGYMACEDHKRHIFISLWSDKLLIKSVCVNVHIIIKECSVITASLQKYALVMMQ